MLLLHPGTSRDREALSKLAAALDGGSVGEPDEIGLFEVSLETSSHVEALQRVWNAVAASGTDDHIVFAEHPERPKDGKAAG